MNTFIKTRNSTLPWNLFNYNGYYVSCRSGCIKLTPGNPTKVLQGYSNLWEYM